VVHNLGAFSILFFVFAPKFSRKLRIGPARKAEAQRQFSHAYQLYAMIVFTAAKSFALPKPKKLQSGKDVQEWITDCVAAYTKYITEKPQHEDLRESAEKLKSIEPNLAYVENKLEPDRSERLTLDGYVNILKSLYFPDQKEVPQKTRIDAADLYGKRISIVIIEGDASSHVEGCFYNLEHNVSVRYSIDHDPGASAVVFLAPGSWVAVSRVVPELSNPKDKIYREARDIQGRYAASFVTARDESQLMMLKFILRPDKPFWA
jgi:hypothetical protein